MGLSTAVTILGQPHVRDAIVSLHASGASPSQIASTLRIDQGTVRSVIKATAMEPVPVVDPETLTRIRELRQVVADKIRHLRDTVASVSPDHAARSLRDAVEVLDRYEALVERQERRDDVGAAPPDVEAMVARIKSAVARALGIERVVDVDATGVVIGDGHQSASPAQTPVVGAARRRGRRRSDGSTPTPAPTDATRPPPPGGGSRPRESERAGTGPLDHVGGG